MRDLCHSQQFNKYSKAKTQNMNRQFWTYKNDT